MARTKTISIRFNDDGSIKKISGAGTPKELAAAAQFGLAFRKAAAADTRSGAMGEGIAGPVPGLFGDLPTKMAESITDALTAASTSQPNETASPVAMEPKPADVHPKRRK